MNAPRPICSLSLDLDNLWSYMKVHGDARWRSLPSFLPIVIPRITGLLERFGWTITVFVVGTDAADDRNRELLASLVGAGHEVGNHSFRHEPWLHLYSEGEIENEIAEAEDAIGAAVGTRPTLFRGPGYSLSTATLKVLSRRGYSVDASTCPTYLGPLARAYYFRRANLDEEQRRQRGALYGGVRDGLRPIRPYLWDVGDRPVLEIPVTTMPLLKLPIHFSYLLYMGCYSTALARQYFRAALGICRLTGTQPSLLLHPLDLLGGDDVEELDFFPAMNVSHDTKSDLLVTLLETLGSRFEVVRMSEHARRLLESGHLPVRSPAVLDGSG